jgi:hypothetical protein
MLNMEKKLLPLVLQFISTVFSMHLFNIAAICCIVGFIRGKYMYN